MSKKKILIIVMVALVVIASLVIAVPALAAGSSPPANPAQITPANKPGALIRLLLVQNEAKVDAYIAEAVFNGKLTPDQAIKVKDFWTAHHKQFAWNFTLRRLLRAQNESNVKVFLDKAVTDGKIKPEQETKILQIWEVLHDIAPTTTTAQ